MGDGKVVQKEGGKEWSVWGKWKEKNKILRGGVARWFRENWKDGKGSKKNRKDGKKGEGKCRTSERWFKRRRGTGEGSREMGLQERAKRGGDIRKGSRYGGGYHHSSLRILP